jgi:hypothetical protein
MAVEQTAGWRIQNPPISPAAETAADISSGDAGPGFFPPSGGEGKKKAIAETMTIVFMIFIVILPTIYSNREKFELNETNIDKFIYP